MAVQLSSFAMRFTKRHAGLVLTWVASVSIAAFVLLLANFGGPQWIFVLCGIWLITIGLPTSLSLVVIAWSWRALPIVGTPPLWAFIVSFLILSFVAHIVSFQAAIKMINRRRAHA